MGKKKSFIIVGSTFLGLVLILLCIPFITKYFKHTRCKFESSEYIAEIGKERALSLDFYGGKKISEKEYNKLRFSYTLEQEGEVVEMLDGSYSSGGYNDLYFWMFLEPEALKTTDIERKEGDKISINDKGYWQINDKPTEYKASKNYPASEIENHISSTDDGYWQFTVDEERISEIPYDKDDAVTINNEGYWQVGDTSTGYKAYKEYLPDEIKSVACRGKKRKECWLLNGNLTDIPCKEGISPERNEATGNWMIDGKDTEYRYKEADQITIKGLKEGTATIKVTGKVGKDEINAETTIKVYRPDPEALKTDYLDNAVILKKGSQKQIDYDVTSASSHKPSQDVIFKIKDGNNIEIEDGKIKAVNEGTSTIIVSVDERSFHIGMPKYIKQEIKVIVLDASDDQIEKIEDARRKIAKVGKIENTPESLALRNDATEAFNLVDEKNRHAVTNRGIIEQIQFIADAEDKINLIPDTLELNADLHACVISALVAEEKVENKEMISNLNKLKDAKEFLKNKVLNGQEIDLEEELGSIEYINDDLIGRIRKDEEGNILFGEDKKAQKIRVIKAKAQTDTFLGKYPHLKDIITNYSFLEKAIEDIKDETIEGGKIPDIYQSIDLVKVAMEKIDNIKPGKERATLIGDARQAVDAAVEHDPDNEDAIMNLNTLKSFEKLT